MEVAATRRWGAVAALALSVLVVGLDLTVLNLALPTLARELHASTGDLQWFIAAYSLVVAAALLPAGMLGDRLGRKRVLIVALIVFGASSAACAYSSSAGELIAFRAVLGLGAAAILPLALSVLPVLFTEEERPKAIAAVSAAIFLSYPVGPILGGWLLDRFWWGSVFLINVPVVVVAVTVVALLMPESRSSERPRVDVIGMGISSLGLATLTYGTIKAGENGWGNSVALTGMLGGAAVLVLFVFWERAAERRAIQPLVDLSLFRSARFTWGTVLTTAVSFAMFGILFAMPQYFQDVRGFDALGSGFRLLPLILGMLVGLVLGGRLSEPRPTGPGTADGAKLEPKAGAKLLVTVGFAVMALGLVVGAFTKVSSGTGFAAAWFAVAGAGLGLAIPSAMNAALGALSAERSGAGSALISAMRQVGATIGVAALGTILSSVYRGHLHLGGLPPPVAAATRDSVGVGVLVAHKLGSAPLLDAVRTAFVHGMDVMLWVCGGIAVANAVLALAFLPRHASTADQGQETGPAEQSAATQVGAAEEER
jgi:MFS transporter, DHA2 family, multidrug resistance protein